MSFWTLDNIKAAIGGSWLARPEGLSRRIDSGELSLAGAAIDSRAVKPGNVFFALRGEKTEGHLFIPQAAASGARLAITERPDALTSLPAGANAGPACAVLLVPDAAQALLRLGAAYRKTLDTTRVIAVGGSNGKTTTTRLIHTILSRTLRGTSSPKSFNNALGVPLTILNAKKSDNYLVCEVGTNAPGEIAVLAGALEPDVAVITSIGREHLEGLASLAGVAREEASLLCSLRPRATAIVPADSPELDEALRTLFSAPGSARSRTSLVRFGISEAADVRIADAAELPLSNPGVRFTLNARTTHHIPLLGRHNALNATAAIIVARRLGVPEAEIAAGLAAAKPAEMRMERRRVSLPGGDIELINDAYNANPDSMLAALGVLAAHAGEGASRRVAVLGDMLEMGDASVRAHEEIGRALARTREIDLVILVGAAMEHAATASNDPARFVRLDSLDNQGATVAASHLRPGDLVLLKGSRRMALERLIPALESRANSSKPS
jgi:UDP-N-acetylmuramoyl-tripeptide--D-alanyl-D-alanine ligase